jgi:hypothetical protein
MRENPTLDESVLVERATEDRMLGEKREGRGMA